MRDSFHSLGFRSLAAPRAKRISWTAKRDSLDSLGFQPQAPLDSYIAGILNEEGCTTVEVSGMPDHVHVLLDLPPRLSLAHLMRITWG